MIFFLIAIVSQIQYKITDCQSTITYTGYGTLDEEYAKEAHGKRKIIICEGITEIGVGAFSQKEFASSALESFIYEEIELPCSLETIGACAFQNYYSELKKIHFPDYLYSSYTEGDLENYYALRYIGGNAFDQNFRIICHNIPPTFTNIVSYSFKSCSIKHIGLNSKITTIPFGPFCYSDLLSIKLPCLVTKISSEAFLGCANLESIVFENAIEITIYSKVFSGCTSLLQVNFPPNVIFYDSTNIFYKCTSLTSVTMPKYLRGNNGLPDNMFKNCTSLRYCTFPENIEIIPAGMFQFTAIENVKIPKTVKEIRDHAFSDCLKLRYVEVDCDYHVYFYKNAFHNTPNVIVMVVRGGSYHSFDASSLTGSRFCLLNPPYESYSNNQAFEKATNVYSTYNYKSYHPKFNGYTVNVISGSVCDIPMQTPFPTITGDTDFSFPWTSDCKNYAGIIGCGDATNTYYPTTKTRSNHYTYSTPTRNPIHQDKDGNSGGKKNNGLSGWSIFFIVIGCLIVVTVIVIVIVGCFCFVTSYKKQISNSSCSDSADPEKPNSPDSNNEEAPNSEDDPVRNESP